MSRDVVVADCNTLNFLLVHHGLEAVLRAMLLRCDSVIHTLSSIYRREAGDTLREALDRLRQTGRAVWDRDPSKESLVGPAKSLHQKIHRAGAHSYRTTSTNDRDLLFLAESLGIPLATDDKPLTSLADSRQHRVLGMDEILGVVFREGQLSVAARDDIIKREAARTQRAQETVRQAITRASETDPFDCVPEVMVDQKPGAALEASGSVLSLAQGGADIA